MVEQSTGSRLKGDRARRLALRQSTERRGCKTAVNGFSGGVAAGGTARRSTLHRARCNSVGAAGGAAAAGRGGLRRGGTVLLGLRAGVALGRAVRGHGLAAGIGGRRD